jgi:ribosomal protein S18 acetylase RimI-like enzyme
MPPPHERYRMSDAAPHAAGPSSASPLGSPGSSTTAPRFSAAPTPGPPAGSAALGLAFRFAGPADVDAVVALVQSAYRGEGSRQGWTTEADWIDGQRTDAAEVGSIVSGTDSEILLGEEAGPGGGLLTSCQLARRLDGRAYFGMFAVRPDQQGRGTGRLLLREAERLTVADWGATVMEMAVLDVRADLIGWYERLGYRRTGETQPFPYGVPAFGVPKVDDLRFAVLARRLDPGT